MEEMKLISLEDWKQAVKDAGGSEAVWPPRKGLVAKVEPKEPPEPGVESRILTFTISTDVVDRDRDTISVDGWDLENYRKNPVVLWAHSHQDPPIAKSPDIRIENGALVADADFVPADISPFAEMIYRMYLGGFLSAVSVGFDPTEWTFVEDDKRPFGVDFKKQELLEFSGVPVPANPDALIAASAAGIDTEPLRKWAADILDDFERVSKEGLFVPKSRLEELAKDGTASIIRPDFPNDPTTLPQPLRICIEAEDGRRRCFEIHSADLRGASIKTITLKQYGIELPFESLAHKEEKAERIQVDGGVVTVSYKNKDQEPLSIPYSWIGTILNFGRAKGWWRYDAEGKQWHYSLNSDSPEQLSRCVIGEYFLSMDPALGKDHTTMTLATRDGSGIRYGPITGETLEELLAREVGAKQITLAPSLEKTLEELAEIIDTLLTRNEVLESRVPVRDTTGSTQGIIDKICEAIAEKQKAEKQIKAQEATGETLFCGLTKAELKEVIQKEVQGEITRTTGRVY